MHSGVGGTDEQRNPGREVVAQKLRDLPTETPPPFPWSELRRRMQNKALMSRGRRRVAADQTATGKHRALAAIVGAIVIVIGSGLLANRIERGGGERAVTRPGVQRAQQPATRAPDEAEELLAGADRAERWLAATPDDSALVRVSTHLAIANLEDRIASMDDLLNVERLQHAHPSRVRALQLQRAQLVDSLAQVRYAEMLVEETQ